MIKSIDDCVHEVLFKIGHHEEFGLGYCARCEQPKQLSDEYELVGRASPLMDVKGRIYNAMIYVKRKQTEETK